ncbi:hypothetical protein JCM30471_29470 [Desulfuromonas carbonis]|uniref:hypothetical protein n=1 Tax=Desulfuromonas sp. DDH964 TaxID=1823759 RepID=UPI00078CA238|nr:hypothetical protein [Desulfuromonas sp. DDH964]AMV71125.1 lipoprotein [Desulfuromonas sp. DDH964]
MRVACCLRLLPLLVLPFFLGCGNDSDATLVRGVVADGYLENAQVCVDRNQNRRCDPDEPAAMSDAQGAFQLIAPAHWLDESPLIAEIAAGTSINHEPEGDVVADRDYLLSTPPGAWRRAPADGRIFISPLTAMVHERMVSYPMTLTEAVAYVRAQIATDADLFVDYLAGEKGGEQAEEYARLHRIARVAALSLQDQMEIFATTAAANGFPCDKANLYAATTRQVQQKLVYYTQMTETARNNPDPRAILDANSTTPGVDEIKAKLAMMAIPAPAADPQPIYAAGLYWADLDMDQDGNLVAEYTRDGLGAPKPDGGYQLDRSSYRFDMASTTWTAVPAAELQNEYHLHLTPEGWVRCDPTIEQTLEFPGNNRVLWTDVPTGLRYSEALGVKKASGEAINTFLYGYGLTAAETAIFPAAAEFYQAISVPLQDIYTIYPERAIPIDGGSLFPPGMTSLREIAALEDFPFANEFREVMGEEVLMVYFVRGAPGAVQMNTGLMVLIDGLLYPGESRAQGVPETYLDFNRAALDAMTSAAIATLP